MNGDKRKKGGLMKKVRKIWNPKTETVEMLRDRLIELKFQCAEGEKLEDLIDIAGLPTCPIPDDIPTTYPIWAMDFENNCLVGENLGEIESLDEIKEKLQI